MIKKNVLKNQWNIWVIASLDDFGNSLTNYSWTRIEKGGKLKPLIIQYISSLIHNIYYVPINGPYISLFYFQMSYIKGKSHIIVTSLQPCYKHLPDHKISTRRKIVPIWSEETCHREWKTFFWNMRAIWSHEGYHSKFAFLSYYNYYY